jgi:hypothetical protein
MSIAKAYEKDGKVFAVDANGGQIVAHPGKLHDNSADRVAIRNGAILTVYDAAGAMLGNTTVALWDSGNKL